MQARSFIFAALGAVEEPARQQKQIVRKHNREIEQKARKAKRKALKSTSP
jgi:hypothetical protein